MITFANPLALFNNWRVRGLVGWFADLLKKRQLKDSLAFARFADKWLQPNFFNLPNLVSIIRALLTIPIVALLVIENRWCNLAAAFIFAISCLSDLIDGPLAKAAGCETKWGATLDPLADKILVLGLIITQNWLLPIILQQLIIGLIAGETAFSLMRLWRLIKQIKPYGSNLTGKTKLYGQIAVAVIMVLKLPLALYANIILLISLLLLYWNIASGLWLIAKFHFSKAVPAAPPN